MTWAVESGKIDAAKSEAFEQTESEEIAGPFACEGDQGAGGVFGFGDVALAGGVEGGGGADDDEENDDHATDAPDQDVSAGLRVLARAHFFLDESGLEIEKLPGGDGGADQAGEHYKIVGIELDAGDHGGFGGEEPVGLGHNRGNNIGDVEAAGHEEDDFHLAVSAFQNQKPDNQRGDGYGDVFADVENFHGGGDAGKFGDDVGEVDEEAGDHDEKCGAEAELFADQVGEAFAGDHAHARAHFFGDVERDGHGDEGPEERVAVMRACLGVGGDAAGVVVDVGGDEAGADYGKEQREAAAQAADALLQVGATVADGGEALGDGGPVHLVRCNSLPTSNS